MSAVFSDQTNSTSEEPGGPVASGAPSDSEPPASQSPREGGGEAPIAPAASGPQVSAECPSGRPDDPFGPTPEAPFGFKKDGTPKTSRAGRPPNHGPRDAVEGASAAANDAARVTTVSRKAPPRTAKASVAKAIVIDYETVAQGFAAVWFSVGTLAFGEEWQPDVEQREHLVVKDAFKRYVEAKQIGDFPPTAGLIVCLATYSLVRLQKPTVRTRLQTMGLNIAKGYQWLKAKLPFGK